MALDVFPVESRYIFDTGQRKLQAKIVCMKCHREEWASVEKPGFASNAFRAKGWLLGTKRTRDVCPPCRNQKNRRPHMSGAQRRAAYNRIEAEMDEAEGLPPKVRPEPTPEPINTVMADALAPLAAEMAERRRRAPKGSVLGGGYNRADNARRAARTALKNPMAREGIDYRVVRDGPQTYTFEIIPQETPMNPTPASASPSTGAAAPRRPTPEENRRVLDAMEQHYIADKGLYRASFTDAAVAETLKVPRAWVTKVREDFYGPDINEAQSQRGAQLDVAIKLAEAATERLITMAQDAEKLANDLKEARKAL